jgi:hypothetical protein
MSTWIDVPKEALRLEDDGKVHITTFLLPDGRILSIWSKNVFPMTDLQIIEASID